ncbi:hypothetical protein [Synechococcus sp. RS9907]|uniref:hypothetical protein n=1 Tax=Synechococcus sp. RS9907 TaxID=221350 RepID=UPI00165D74F7|nr:hypothetical protein [Synechococcus sp. RS9907]
MAKITNVLFDGSYENYGHIYELEDGKIVFYSDGGYFQAGDDLVGSYRSFSQSQFGEVALEDIVVQQWGSQGPLFYFLKDGNFYSHAFTETNDGKVEPVGSLKAEKIDQLYDLENGYGTDFDSDGVTGRPPVTISRVLFGGSGYGDLFELEGGDVILYTNEINYESGDKIYDSYKRISITELNGVVFEDVVFTEWDNNGPKLYFLSDGDLYSQKFYDRDEQYGYLEAVGSLVQESQERLYEIEGQYGEDLNSDGEIGEPPVVIERVLFDGSRNGNGSLFELEGGEVVFLHGDQSYEIGDELDHFYDYYQTIEETDFGDVSLEDVVLSDWGNNGPRFYFWSGDALYRQEFRDRNGQLETDGALKNVDNDRLYELEDQFGEDLNGDGEAGTPPVVIERVLFDGSRNGNGSLFELEGGEVVFLHGDQSYEIGDELDHFYDYYQTIEETDFGDVSLEDVVLSDWGNNGPRFYFWSGDALYRQEFRDRNGQLETDGALKNVDNDRLYELEDQFGEDLNGDGEAGTPPVVIERVFFDGSRNGNGSLFELEGGEVVFLHGDELYEKGDELDKDQFDNYYYQTIEETDFGDVSLEDVVLSDWGNNGPRFYFWSGDALYRQEFRDRNGQLETDGNLKSLDEDKLYELEDQFGEDLNGDGETGKPPVVIERVLFDGSNNGSGNLFELEGGEIVWYINGGFYEQGEDLDDHYFTIDERDFGNVSLEDVVLSGWGGEGPKFYLWSGEALFSQEYRELFGRLEAKGSLKSVKEDRLYELEDQFGEDLNGDEEIGTPPVVIERILFDGSNNGNGSLFELEGGEIVWLSSGDSYEKGDEIDGYYQTIEESDFGDVTLEDVVLSDWGNKGPKFYFWNGESLYSQEFRERNGQLKSEGNLKNEKQKNLYELEDQYGLDIDGDDEIGEPLATISTVLFSGEEGDWDRGLYELDDATIVMSESELEEGDTPFDIRQLVTSKGDDFAVDGDVLGGYWINNGFAVLYEDGAKIMRQNFRETGDVARTNGKPKSLSSKQVAELEEEQGVDFNGDGVYGEESAEISSVLFAGDEGDWDRGLYELDDATIVMSESELEEGDTPSEAYQLVTSKGDDFAVDGDVLGGYWINKGFAVLYEDGAKIMRQNFREMGDVARTNGRPKSLSSKQVAELEEEQGVDFNGDGVYGEESAEISSVLFAGDEGSWGRGLYELDDATIVASESELEEGDTPSEAYQLVTSKGDDFAVDGDVLGGYWINKGFAVLYEDGAKIMRQNFRESGDVARTNGKPKSLSSKQVAELEEDHGVDFNGDSLIGPELPLIETVLFDGLQGDWGQGIYDATNGSLMIGEKDLDEGDEIIDGVQLMSVGNDGYYEVDGDVVGAFGGSNSASIVYEQSGDYYSQSFGISDSIAIASGSPELVSDRIFALEDIHDIDFNGDGSFGEVSG